MTGPAPLRSGAVLWVELPSHRPRGHEQEGMRPCVLVADPALLQPTRFPNVIVAPLTRKRLQAGPLYIRLEAGAGSLPAASTVLLDQIRAIDCRRVRGVVGELREVEYAPIRDGLRRLLNL